MPAAAQVSVSYFIGYLYKKILSIKLIVSSGLQGAISLFAMLTTKAVVAVAYSCGYRSYIGCLYTHYPRIALKNNPVITRTSSCIIHPSSLFSLRRHISHVK